MNEASVASDPGVTNTGERLHPLGLFIGFIGHIPQLLFPMFAALFGARRSGIDTPLIILAVLLLSLFFHAIGWFRFRYYLGDDDVRIEHGVFNRTTRSIPYDRIQDVSIEQRLMPRLLGLAEVKFETGGGGGKDEEARLRYVATERAAALRDTVRSRRAEVAPALPRHVLAREAPALFAMDSARLVSFGIYSFSLIIFALLWGVVHQIDFLLPNDIWDPKHWIELAQNRGLSMDGVGIGARVAGVLLLVIALIILGIVSGIIRVFLKDYGFRLDRTDAGFRRQRGLFTKTDVVMPVNRVQGAVIATGPIRKLRGWHALKFVSLAQDSKDESDFVAAPFAQLDEIWPIVRKTGLSAPEAGVRFRQSRFLWWGGGLVVLWATMVAVMFAIMVFADALFTQAGWMLLVPFFFAPVVWTEWRTYGDFVDAQQLYVREGWWRQRLVIAPQMKVQSAEIAQGPIGRMLGLCRLHFGIAGGKLAFAALPIADARAIRDAVMAKVAPVDFSALNQRD